MDSSTSDDPQEREIVDQWIKHLAEADRRINRLAWLFLVFAFGLGVALGMVL